jgi:pyroglutamyl-peptidase
MKSNFWVLAWTIGLGLSTIGAASDITLTSFQPFGGVSVNNSNEVAKRLAVLLRRTPSVQVDECLLPVVYDAAAKVALDCIGGRHPNLVLSLGAGSCEIDFETRATNYDYARVPDNAGNLRNAGTPILKGAPKHVALSAPMTALYRNSKQRGRARLFRSWDAGSYVCNNTAYWLAYTFAAEKRDIPYGFIHVPPVTCGADTAAPEVIAQTIYDGLRTTMPELFR